MAKTAMNRSANTFGAAVRYQFLSPKAKLVIAPVSVNGQGPFDFIVDTGNGSFPVLISNELAARLGIENDSGDRQTGFTVALDE